MQESSGGVDLGIVAEILQAGIRLPFDGSLHQFQLEDINKRARKKCCGFFWDIGLGKTTAGALTAAYHLLHGFDRAYFVCPASLLEQWYETLVKMNFDTQLYAGTPNERKTMHFDHDAIVMSFEIFQKDFQRVKQYPGFYVVDEATILSNPGNLFYKMMNGGIVEKKKHIPGLMKPFIEKIQFEGVNEGCCLLTATPSNHPGDLYGLINTIAPEIYTSKFQFNRLHVSEENIFGTPSAFDNLELLKENVEAVASIRFATDHLDLPDIVYNTIEYDLAPEHLALYQELVENRLLTYKGKITIDALQATSFYNWAQKIVVNPDQAMFQKDPKVLQLVDTVVRNNPRTLLINKYVMTNQKMMERYKDIGIGGCFGGISRAAQTRYVDQFKAGKLRVLTVNPKSGGVGLNLQICHNAVFPEIPVTARDFRQALGRVYRQGQEHRVIATIYIARKTIQQTLIKRLMLRDDIMSQVIVTPSTLREDLFPRR